MSSSFVVLQTAAPDYRKKFFSLLQKECGGKFTLFAGDNYFEGSVKTDKTIPGLVHLRNHYFFKNKFLFQTGMWRAVLGADNLVMEMNPRIVSSWIILALRRMMFKKTTLWGHAWPRAGKNSRSDKLRHMMRKLGSSIVCYTGTQARQLQSYMPNKLISYAPNAVYYQREMQPLPPAVCNNFIYVGRLTKAKKPVMAVKAFYQIYKDLPADVQLVIVGDGQQKQVLHDLVKELGIESRVQLPGHVADYTTLQELYAKSFASLSPGYVGLSITQSLAFGVPMIISRDENHSPEIECAIEDENAVFFDTDNVESLATQMMRMCDDKELWQQRKPAIQTFCQDNYSVEAMVRGYLEGVLTMRGKAYEVK